jgi:hypothetical protein
MQKDRSFLKMARSNFRMKLFMLKKLPLALLVGLKILEVDTEKAVVSIPYKFLNKNPFQSIYFAALSMAAELSTGVLAMAAISERNVAISMLVFEMEARFLKKAQTKIIFTCQQGSEISQAVDKCIESGIGQTVKVLSKGTDISGTEVAEFYFTWTFKPKSKSS